VTPSKFVYMLLASLPALVLAQSNPPLRINQAGFASLHLVPQNALFAQHAAEANQASVSSPSAIPSSGLNFLNPVTYSSGGAIPHGGPIVVDINGDGKPDLVVVNECVEGVRCDFVNTEGTIGVLLGNGDGTFQPAVNYSSGGDWAQAIAVADVNGDGVPDLLVSNGESLGVLLGNGDGTFQTAVTYPAGGAAMAVADVNRDGKLDIVLPNVVLLGNGDGTFNPPLYYNGYLANSLAVGDVNGDGKLDVVGGAGGGVFVFLGNGDGTFQAPVQYASGGSKSDSVAVADLNGDGKLDIVVANECISSSACDPGLVGVLLGNGDGTFQPVVTYSSTGFEATRVKVKDVNGDGKPDIVVVNTCAKNNDNCAEGSVVVLLGNGNGTFQAGVVFDTPPDDLGVTVADVNGDGKPDLIVTNLCTVVYGCPKTSVISVLLNASISGTTTKLTSAPNPSKFGQSVTFTATVTPLAGFYKGTPAGTVTFQQGTTTLGSSALNSSGVATLTVSTLAVGTHSITASYGGSTTFAPSTAPVLKQVVQGSIAQLSPASLNFGNQTVDMVSAAKIVTLTNEGNIALTISSIGITGTDHADFAQSHTCGASVAAGASCTISVTFTPTTTGTRTATLSILDNAPQSPQTVGLTGVGVLPAVTFAPTSLAFPTQIVFTTSAAKTVTLTNSGVGVLKITSVAVTGQFAQTNNCGSTVDPSSSCTLTVTFKPTSTGALAGSIAVTDNAPGSPQKVALTGTGTAVELRPTSVNFGNQPTGTTSLVQTITLTNQGHATISTSITITGADPADFAQTNTCGTSVVSGASCFIKVTFTPKAAGARSAAVSVTDNGGGSPQKVPLAGTGT
jgi:Bacterial Ig-like domain (group 3)/FG-GAP-like repeat/Abnormal spindle-like microcephaly-assoc'd, ASPM-SPD-2-Hydin